MQGSRTSVAQARTAPAGHLPTSANVVALKRLYAAHIGLLCPLALLLVAWPQAVVDDVDDPATASLVIARSYGCTLLALCFVLHKYRAYERLKHHRGLAKALLLLHALGFVLFLVVFAVRLGASSTRWLLQLSLGLGLHTVFVAALAWRPGLAWILKTDWHHHVAFRPHPSVEHDVYAHAQGPGESLLHRCLHRCTHASQNDELNEALQDLWDVVDLDQTGVLSTSQCIVLLRELALMERQRYVSAFKALKDVEKKIHDPLVCTQLHRMAWETLSRVDKYLEGLDKHPQHMVEDMMSRLDMDSDGQVEKLEFVTRAGHVLFNHQAPITVLHLEDVPSECPVQ